MGCGYQRAGALSKALRSAPSERCAAQIKYLHGHWFPTSNSSTRCEYEQSQPSQATISWLPPAQTNQQADPPPLPSPSGSAWA